MPSLDNLRAAQAWMQQNRDGGGTNVISAVNHAFQSCSGAKGHETVQDLSIIIISDGVFTNFSGLGRAIQEGQRTRRRKKMPEAAIGFFGIDDESHKQQIKHLVGTQAKGKYRVDEDKGLTNAGAWTADKCILGYFRLIYPEPKPEEPDAPPVTQPQKKKSTKPQAKKKPKKTKIP